MNDKGVCKTSPATPGLLAVMKKKVSNTKIVKILAQNAYCIGRQHLNLMVLQLDCLKAYLLGFYQTQAKPGAALQTAS